MRSLKTPPTEVPGVFDMLGSLEVIRAYVPLFLAAGVVRSEPSHCKADPRNGRLRGAKRPTICHFAARNAKKRARPSHWDLMLEFGGVLLTWELPTLAFESLPASFERLNIRRLADHRLAYLSYEGPVSNDRGEVQRIDAGRFEVLEASEIWVRVRAIGAEWQIEMRLPKAVFSGNNVRSTDGSRRKANQLAVSCCVSTRVAKAANTCGFRSTNHFALRHANQTRAVLFIEQFFVDTLWINLAPSLAIKW